MSLVAQLRPYTVRAFLVWQKCDLRVEIRKECVRSAMILAHFTCVGVLMCVSDFYSGVAIRIGGSSVNDNVSDSTGE